MVPTYFHLKLEFDTHKVDSMIQTTVARKAKGYVCLVESNLVALANRYPAFREVVNGALVNICCGSVVARILGIIHNKTVSVIRGCRPVYKDSENAPV